MLLNSSYLVHGLDTDGDNVAKARAYIRSKNLYGPVSVAKYDGKTLPYGDNIVNLIVADTLGDVSTEEAMRVLTPLGAMVVGGKKTVKPWPKDIDDWPQYLNKADNNAVAKDSVAGPPRHDPMGRQTRPGAVPTWAFRRWPAWSPAMGVCSPSKTRRRRTTRSFPPRFGLSPATPLTARSFGPARSPAGNR